MRPGSRGTGWRAPGTASRLGTGMRLGTGSRLGTGRLRTGVNPSQGTEAAMGNAINANVKLADRPVTQQGMAGAKRVGTANKGQGRSVEDPAFFITILRKKVDDINAELEKMNDQIERFERDESQYNQWEKRYESLLSEVRSLEGQLADYNLAMDKTRTHTDPDDVYQYQRQLRSKNRTEATEMDRIFLLKQKHEKRLTEVEKNITKIHQEQEERINKLDPQKLQQYREMLEESDTLQGEINEGQTKLAQITTSIQRIEMDLKRYSHQEEYEKYEKLMSKLRRERKMLESDLEISGLDPREAHARLLAKVKADNASKEELESQSQEIKQEITRMKRHLNEISTDFEERKGETKDSQKVEVLYKRDSEMTTFLDNFDNNKRNLYEERKETESNIVKLLEHISYGLEQENSMPTPDAFGEMKGEAEFKKNILESAQMTKERLQAEKEKRLKELDKIGTLDEKIALELRSLRNKMDNMKDEMIEFEDVDKMRDEADRTQEYLEDLRRKYIKRRDTIGQQIHQLSGLYESDKKALNRSNTAKNLETLEKRIQHHEQSIFTLNEYVVSKTKETDYERIREDCLDLVGRLNGNLKERLNKI